MKMKLRLRSLAKNSIHHTKAHNVYKEEYKRIDEDNRRANSEMKGTNIKS